MQITHESSASGGESHSFICHYAKKEESCVVFHKSYEILYVLSGELTVRVNETVETVSPGEFVMILPDQVHYVFCSGVPVRYWVCMLQEGYISKFANYVKDKTGAGIKFTCPGIGRYLNENVLANALITDTGDTVAGGKAWEGAPLEAKLAAQPCAAFQLDACLSAIFSSYVQQIELIPQKKGTQTLAHQMLDYIWEHCQENITLNDAAKALGYSANYLSRCSRIILGTNFRQFINQQRLARAQELIHENKMPITEIAAKSGFGTVRNFNLIYKTMTGKTPSEEQR